MAVRVRIKIEDRLKTWSTFAEIAGTAAASLIGLLFVAVSIRIDFIARSQELRNRAAQTLSLFGTVLLTAILIAVPGQATEALGAELTALAVIAGGGLAVLDRRAKADASTKAIRKTLELITPTTIVSILLLASGVLLVFGSTWRALRVGRACAGRADQRCGQRLAVSHKDHRIAAQWARDHRLIVASMLSRRTGRPFSHLAYGT